MANSRTIHPSDQTSLRSSYLKNVKKYNAWSEHLDINSLKLVHIFIVSLAIISTRAHRHEFDAAVHDDLPIP